MTIQQKIEAMENLADEMGLKPSKAFTRDEIEMVQAACSVAFGVPFKAIIGGRRKSRVFTARAASIHICRVRYNVPLAELSISHGRGENSGSLNAYNRACDMLDVDKAFQQKYQAAIKLIDQFTITEMSENQKRK